MLRTSSWFAVLFVFALVPAAGSIALAQGAAPAPPPAGAPNNPALGPCKSDVAKFCAGVKAGGGRIIACLKEHEAELGESCKGSLAGPPRGRAAMAPPKAGAAEPARPHVGGPAPAGGTPQREWGPMRGMQQKCGPDVAKFCKDVQAGHGRVASCLNEHAGELSAPCKAIVSNVMTRMGEPMAAHADCADDAKKLCADVAPGSGRTAFCLGEHSADLSPGCRKQVEAMKARWEKGPLRAAPRMGNKPGAPIEVPSPPPAK
jgi:hypothetical protein